MNIGWYRTIEVEGVKVNFQLDTGVKYNIISHNVFKTKVASVTSVCGRNKYAGNEPGGVPYLFIYLSVVESLVRMFIKHFNFRSLMRTKCQLFIQLEVYFGQDYIILVSVSARVSCYYTALAVQGT